MNAITNSIVIAFLVALAYYDIRTRLVDDRLVLLGMVVVAPLQCWLRGWEFALSGLVCGLLVSYAAYLLSRCIHRERTGFGGGDVTAAAFIGLAVGWSDFIFVFLVAHFIHLLVTLFLAARLRTFQVGAPFVPAFALAAVINIFLPGGLVGLASVVYISFITLTQHY